MSNIKLSVKLLYLIPRFSLSCYTLSIICSYRFGKGIRKTYFEKEWRKSKHNINKKNKMKICLKECQG